MVGIALSQPGITWPERAGLRVVGQVRGSVMLDLALMLVSGLRPVLVVMVMIISGTVGVRVADE